MMHHVTQTTIIFIDKLIIIKCWYMKFNHQKTSTLLHCNSVIISTNDLIPQLAKFMGPTWAHLGPVGPRWAPCWAHEPCYQGWLLTESVIIGHHTHSPVYHDTFSIILDLWVQQNIFTWAKLFNLNNFQYKHPQQDWILCLVYSFISILKNSLRVLTHCGLWQQAITRTNVD